MMKNPEVEKRLTMLNVDITVAELRRRVAGHQNLTRKGGKARPSPSESSPSLGEGAGIGPRITP